MSVAQYYCHKENFYRYVRNKVFEHQRKYCNIVMSESKICRPRQQRNTIEENYV